MPSGHAMSHSNYFSSTYHWCIGKLHAVRCAVSGYPFGRTLALEIVLLGEVAFLFHVRQQLSQRLLPEIADG